MSRIALISDLHANLEALTAVLNDIDQRGISQVYCLGDTVDYGANPNEVIETLQERNIPTILGNHDDFHNRGISEGVGYAVILSYEWTRKELTPSSRKFLRSLASSYREIDMGGRSILFVHGSPEGPLDDYILVDPRNRHSSLYKDDRQLELLFNTKVSGTGPEPDVSITEKPVYDGYFSGHIHIPFVKAFGDRVAVNVGSVGQPRDENPDACYCITDGTVGGTELVRVRYDIDAAATKIRKAGLPESSASRLFIGR